MATFDQFISSLANEFGEQGKGKPFETFCKWFLENDPEWSRIIDKVWLWDDYPNKWQRQDLGTDLVFRDNEGLIWAVQAKCYGEHRTTTKGDMNSFLADTGRKEVDRRLWLQTTNKIEAKAEKTLKGQDKLTTVFMLNDFRDAQIDYPACFADLYKAKVKDKPKPDPHQIKAIEDVTAGLRSSERGQMIMACGTGKTFTTLWIKEALEAHTTLVLLPSLSLLSQTMREWAWAGNTDFDILNVCSDKSVGKKTEDMDPADAPFPVTSDVEEIAEFLKQPNPKVVFCTYQSSDLIAHAQLYDDIPTFDLAIADEAHRCAGKADAGFATILDGYKIRASKRLFTTATPRVSGSSTKDVGNLRGVNTIGMDDEAAFGPVIHKLTFGQAIYYEPEPLLNDYQVIIVGVDEPMVREWIENYEIVSTDPDNQTDARTLAAKIGLLKAVKDYDLKRVISFHSRVAGAKQFSDELVDVANLIEPANRPEGTFLSDYVSGEMKAGDRKEKIDRLKVLEGYDRGILTNARCLAEGVDVPSLDGVAFIDPKGSQVEIIQAVGRAIRKVRGAKVQKKGTIVLPVFIEDGDDHEASIEASNFKPVWDVLKALRDHDEVLADTLDQYRTNMAKNVSQNRESISDKIIFDLPMSVDAEFSAALRTVLVEASTASWEFWFGLLEQYVADIGHAAVPSKYITLCEVGYQLGVWCDTQRVHFQKGTLSKPRFEKLAQLLNVGWTWSLKDTQREYNVRRLRDFYLREHHSFVKERHKEPDGFALGARVKSLIQAYEAGTLENRLIRQLEDDLEFKWDASKFWWLAQYAALRRWARKNQSTRPPANTFVKVRLSKNHYEERDINLFRARCITSFRYWEVSETQPNSKRKIPPRRLSKREIAALEKIPNWSWEEQPSVEVIFLECLNKFLVQYAIRDLKSSTEFEGVKLGNKLTKVKAKYRRGALNQDVINELNSRGISLDPFKDKWKYKLKLVQMYLSSSDKKYIRQDTVYEGERIGAWVSTQRTNYKSGKLPPNKTKQLEDLPNWSWDASDQAAHKASNGPLK
ncbi:Helicase associated domain protein [Yoonia sp.]|uniref:Helicase associated domain protein n=1 Tax=Yoonia sp. TaxID=2212373 RepID=UPI004048D12F